MNLQGVLVKWSVKMERDVAYRWEVASIMPFCQLVKEQLGLVGSSDGPKQPLLVLVEGGRQPLHHGGAILCWLSLIPQGQELILLRDGGGGCGGGSGLGGARGNLLYLGHSG